MIYDFCMITWSTVVPVVGSLYVAIHWLVDAWKVNRKTKIYHQIDHAIREEAKSKFDDSDLTSFDWIRSETDIRLKAAGFKDDEGITMGDTAAASRVGSLKMPVAQQIDQWILIVSSIVGVVLMSLGL
jgi:hypothetical protein